MNLQECRMDETEHRQVVVEWEGAAILVDEELAPLLPLLWQQEIETWASCQATYWYGGQSVWINFATIDDGTRFLEACLVYADRIFPDKGERLLHEWDWRASPRDHSLEVSYRDARGRFQVPVYQRREAPWVEWTVAVYFPRESLPFVLAAFQ